MAGLLSPANAFWLIAGNATQTVFDGGTLLHELPRRPGHLARRGGVGLPEHRGRRHPRMPPIPCARSRTTPTS